MPISRACLAILLLVLFPIEAGARGAKAIWDDRCEECHGDPVKFAGKYLWKIEGQLQGQHHIDNLKLFMGNHYIPDHAIETIRDMLLTHANSPVRFIAECGDCHGDAADFVEKSIWVRGNAITGMGTGKDLSEFLPGHEGLQGEDITFYLKLFARIAGKPLQ